MEIMNNGFNPETGKVEVIFEKDGFKHTRQINAILGEGGAYDEDATEAIIQAQANGVAYKMSIGVIRNENIPLPEMDITPPELAADPAETPAEPEEENN